MATDGVRSIDGQLRAGFLRAVLPEHVEGLAYHLVVNEHRGESAPGRWREYEAETVADLLELSDLYADAGELYVATALFEPGKGRKPFAVRSKSTLSADLDVKGMPGATPGKKSWNLRALVKAIPGDFITITTGGGFHVHLPLSREHRVQEFIDQPDGVAHYETLARAFRLFLEAKARELFDGDVSIDHTHGVARVWRLPASFNMKHATAKRRLDSRRSTWKPVTLRKPASVEALERVLPIDPASFLQPFMEPAGWEVEEQAAAGSAQFVDAVRGAGDDTFKLDLLPTRVLEDWPWKIGDQSGHDFNLACLLVEHGHTEPEVIAGALRARRAELDDVADQEKGERADYLARTIGRAIAHTEPRLALLFTDDGDRGAEMDESAGDDQADDPDAERRRKHAAAEVSKPHAGTAFSADRAKSMDSYRFPMAWPEGHYVRRYIMWASGRTDAAWDYHEAAALTLLATCSSNLRAHLPPYPRGLGTNLYVLLLGNTTSSRKSTAIGLARAGILEGVLEDSILPDRLTPEAFVERVGKRQGKACTWVIDEFGGVLADIHHRSFMQALREILLTVYGGSDYRYARRTKRGAGGEMKEDEAVIRKPNLSVLAGCTPAIFRTLQRGDIEDGLLPRFAIVYPNRKPPRKPIWQAPENAESERRELTRWLADVNGYNEQKPPIEFAPDALRTLDAFGADVEDYATRHVDSVSTVMFQRLPPMAIKVAMLTALGRPLALPEPGSFEVDERKPLQETMPVRVTNEDAEIAVAVLDRWRTYATYFADGIQADPFQGKVVTFLRRLAEMGGRAMRRDLARALHYDKRTMDGILETLLERGEIRLDKTGARSYMIVRELPDEPKE